MGLSRLASIDKCRAVRKPNAVKSCAMTRGPSLRNIPETSRQHILPNQIDASIESVEMRSLILDLPHFFNTFATFSFNAALAFLTDKKSLLQCLQVRLPQGSNLWISSSLIVTFASYSSTLFL